MAEEWKPITGLDELTQAAAAPAPVPKSLWKAQSARALQETKTAPDPKLAANYATGSQHCSLCNSPIVKEFYRVNGQLACGNCAAVASSGQAITSSTSFSQALMLGTMAAAVGLIIYSAFTIVTHFYLSYVALAVGWMVGKAMMSGSNGVGGRRYQIAAVVLTYAAISMSAIPIRIAEIAPAAHVDWGDHMGMFVISGIASPFMNMMNGFSGLIGLVILFVGLSVAWRMTRARRLPVDGPHPILG
ncbi:MAG: hypothetical protein ABSD67_20420 [Terracidiphilus sp.]|jgi:hypothetical protein